MGEAFVPLMPTTTTKFVPPTATRTATSTFTSTVSSTTTLSLTLVSEVDVTTEAVSTSTSTGTGAGMMQTTDDPSGPARWLCVVGGVAVGAAGAIVALLFQKARKGVDELALDV